MNNELILTNANNINYNYNICVVNEDNIMKGWKNSEKVVSDEELDHELHHLHGFFRISMDNEGKEWTRNSHELRQRDLTLFCLGEVKGKKIKDVFLKFNSN